MYCWKISCSLCGWYTHWHKVCLLCSLACRPLTSGDRLWKIIHTDESYIGNLCVRSRWKQTWLSFVTNSNVLHSKNLKSTVLLVPSPYPTLYGSIWPTGHCIDQSSIAQCHREVFWFVSLKITRSNRFRKCIRYILKGSEGSNQTSLVFDCSFAWLKS